MAATVERERERSGHKEHGAEAGAGSSRTHEKPSYGCGTGKPFVEAHCPVSGHLVDETGVHLDTPQVMLKNGQRIYMCSTDCIDRFKGDVKRWLAAPGEARFAEKPDMLGKHVSCPECKSGSAPLVVKDDTPRLLLKHGQTIYFNSYGCLAAFLKSPSFGGPLSLASLVLGESRASGLNAVCPVTGKKFPVDDKAHFVEFKHGQRIYTCCAQCPPVLMRSVGAYLRTPAEPYAHPAHPSIVGLTQMCTSCPHSFIVDEELTPRLQFKGGQNLFFHTNACADEFMYAPHKFMMPLTAETVVQPTGIEREREIMGHETGSLSREKLAPFEKGGEKGGEKEKIGGGGIGAAASHAQPTHLGKGSPGGVGVGGVPSAYAQPLATPSLAEERERGHLKTQAPGASSPGGGSGVAHAQPTHTKAPK